MFKWLLLFLVGFVFVGVVKSRNSRSSHRPGKPTPVQMVRCEQCGLHLATNEAMCFDGNFFCSESHLKQWRSSR